MTALGVLLFLWNLIYSATGLSAYVRRTYLYVSEELAVSVLPLRYHTGKIGYKIFLVKKEVIAS